VVTTRPFAKHETVLIDHPVLLVRYDFMRSERVGEQLRRRMLTRAVEQLPPGTRDAVAALARSTSGLTRDGGWVADAIRTNAFGVEVDGVNHHALFLDGSRVNHGCRPK